MKFVKFKNTNPIRVLANLFLVKFCAIFVYETLIIKILYSEKSFQTIKKVLQKEGIFQISSHKSPMSIGRRFFVKL